MNLSPKWRHTNRYTYIQCCAPYCPEIGSSHSRRLSFLSLVISRLKPGRRRYQTGQRNRPVTETARTAYTMSQDSNMCERAHTRTGQREAGERERENSNSHLLRWGQKADPVIWDGSGVRPDTGRTAPFLVEGVRSAATRAPLPP